MKLINEKTILNQWLNFFNCSQIEIKELEQFLHIYFEFISHSKSFDDSDISFFLKKLKKNSLSVGEIYILFENLRELILEKNEEIISNRDFSIQQHKFFLKKVLDIYSQMNYFNETKKHQNALIDQSKSAAMGEMISMIAHQWRQPLQAVSILVQKLPLVKMIDGEINDKLLDGVVTQVISQLDYMSKTIDDFRDYFKPNKKKQAVLIEEVVNKSLKFLDYLFKTNNIKVSYNNTSSSKIEIFLNELIQVLINLFKNSSDAMNEKNIKNRFININSFEIDNYLIIEIDDNAGGISENFLHKIFDPYFSTKTTKNGTGLGLYMCKQIIQKHSHGDIFAQNSEFGLKFTIKLPLK